MFRQLANGPGVDLSSGDVSRLSGWLGVAGVLTAAVVACGGGQQGAPPLPSELRRLTDEPVQELACVSCHGPGGEAEDIPASPGMDLPDDHVPLEAPSGQPGDPSR